MQQISLYKKTDGTEFFNSSEGFVGGAFAQIAAETGTRVSTFAETFTGNIGDNEANDASTYEKITIDQSLSLQQTLKFDVSQFGKTADVEFHGDPANPLILNITNGATPALSDIKKADGSTPIGRDPKNGEFIRLNFTNVQAVNTGGLIGGSSGLFWAPEGFLNADGTALVSSFPFFTAVTIISVPTGNSTVVYKVNHTGNNRLYFNFLSGSSSLSRLNTPTQALTPPAINDPLSAIELELLTRPTFGGTDTKIIDTGDNSIGGTNPFTVSQVTSAPTSIDANTVYVLESSSQTINSSGIPVKRLTKEPILGVGAVSSEGFVSRSVTTSYSGTAGTPVIKYYHSKCFITFAGGSATDKSTTSRQFSVNTTTSGSGFLLASSGQATTSAQNIDLTNIVTTGTFNVTAGDSTSSGVMNFSSFSADESGGFFNFNHGSTPILTIAGQGKPGIDFKSNIHSKFYPHTDKKITFASQTDGTDIFVFNVTSSPELDISGPFTIDSTSTITLEGTGIDLDANVVIDKNNNRTALTGTTLGTLHIKDGDTATAGPPAVSEVGAITFGGVSGFAQPTAIMGVQHTNTGSSLFFGTSNNYSSGVTNTALTIDKVGAATFASSVDATNFKINGSQGSDGQVLTSTGSGVAWEDA
ncbi:MAG: hypothetical protein CMK29_02025, partial [Porticoccaceae bacterium]|nr:hypothetical protein [Porticoccaceae bacterium]